MGITEPEEIDLDAIAWVAGAKVRYRPLHGCEARIMGHGEHAIISIDSRKSARRRRFSLAHELGHWCHHRGRLLMCRSDEIGGGRGRSDAERVANRYAADLLMPAYIFDPASRSYGKLNFATVDALAASFQVSRTATAIRLVDRGHSSALLVCHDRRGRKWFRRSPDVPERWFPRSDMDAESYAFDVLFGGKPGDASPRKIGADAWFDRIDASRFELREQTIRASDEETLTLLLLDDPQMLED